MILVTGATGHIGNVLIRQLLENGEKVRALILKEEDTTPIQDLQVEKIEGDVLDLNSLETAFKGVDTVYHLAGIISIMPGQNPFVWEVNVKGTRIVLQTALQEGVRRLVYTSSIHAIARAPHGIQIDETLPFDTNNPYGAYDRSKAEASLDVQKACRDGLDAVIVCPTGVIGPFDFRRSEMGNVILDAARRKTSLYVDGAYDFVDVRDVAPAFYNAMQRGTPGERYLLGGPNWTLERFFGHLERVSKVSAPRFKVPAKLHTVTSKLVEGVYKTLGKTPPLDPISMEMARYFWYVDSTKAKEELDFTPRDPQETLYDTVEYLRTHFLGAGIFDS